jgi:hypothetical protein
VVVVLRETLLPEVLLPRVAATSISARTSTPTPTHTIGLLYHIAAASGVVTDETDEWFTVEFDSVDEDPPSCAKLLNPEIKTTSRRNNLVRALENVLFIIAVFGLYIIA